MGMLRESWRDLALYVVIFILPKAFAKINRTTGKPQSERKVKNG